MELSIQAALRFKTEECITCGVMFAMPSEFQERLRENHNSFYCPNGHKMYYSGKSESEKLRDELRRKEQELADTAIEKRRLENKITEVNRKLNRVHNGVCPCCNRSFKNLKRHMATKHPDHKK